MLWGLSDSPLFQSYMLLTDFLPKGSSNHAMPLNKRPQGLRLDCPILALIFPVLLFSPTP